MLKEYHKLYELVLTLNVVLSPSSFLKKYHKQGLLSCFMIMFFPSSLLKEYHELYELQRRRLENQITNTTFEKELWQQAAYDLSWRVAQEHSLQTLQRLQLSEKAWCKLAGHFVILLSSKDTEQVRTSSFGHYVPAFS